MPRGNPRQSQTDTLLQGLDEAERILQSIDPNSLAPETQAEYWEQFLEWAMMAGDLDAIESTLNRMKGKKHLSKQYLDKVSTFLRHKRRGLI